MRSAGSGSVENFSPYHGVSCSAASQGRCRQLVTLTGMSVRRGPTSGQLDSDQSPMLYELLETQTPAPKTEEDGSYQERFLGMPAVGLAGRRPGPRRLGHEIGREIESLTLVVV